CLGLFHSLHTGSVLLTSTNTSQPNPSDLASTHHNMRFTAAFVSSLSLVTRTASAPTKKYDRGALFQSWNTECGSGSGHTWGMNIVERAWEGLCFPLPDDTCALELNELADGCRITAFAGPTCDDYPASGAYRDQLGCLWTGNTEYRSYKLTCDK
ncbi:hypothetical protein F5144DRAFT_640269, partial [Chaetomium tenue]